MSPELNCSPYFDNQVNKMVCPEGHDLHAVECWYCQGIGCKYCWHTGMMPGCTWCRGNRHLIGDIIKFIVREDEKEQHPNWGGNRPGSICEKK